MNHSRIYEYNPSGKPIQYAVIWLHGIGASGDDFLACVPQLSLFPHLAVRFIFPHATRRPVSIYQGQYRTSWFDILEKSECVRRINEQELEQSSYRIEQIIQSQQRQGILRSHMVLVGFSQGGVVAYHTALKQSDLGGLIALSTYLMTPNEAIQITRHLPILIQHGTEDRSVYPHFAMQAYERLQALGFKPDYQQYKSHHQVSIHQLTAIGAWLNQHFSAIH